MSGGGAGRIVCLLRASLAFAVVTAGAIVMLLVAVLTLFRLRRLYAETLAGAIGRLVLGIWGIDVVVLISLRLPDTRFFMSGFLRKILPLGLIGYLIGIIWTVPQEFPEKRTRIFERAERLLRRTGESVYLSPEGRRVTEGGIGHFNKGAFHLATSLRAPLLPFYIFIPPEIDPGMGFCARPGTVHVWFKPPIDTSGWRLEDLVGNKEAVRQRFVAWHHEHYG